MMSPIKGMSPSTVFEGSGSTATATKGTRPKVAEPMKRKSLSVKKKDVPTPTTGPRTRKGIPKKAKNSKGGSDSADASDDENSDYGNDLEEIYEVTYVEDFIDAVDNADDLARQKTQFLEMHCDQLILLERIQEQMSKLLSSEGGDFEPGRLNNEKKEVLKYMEDMLIQVAHVSDKGRRICDDFETIIESKLRTLNIDFNNLTAERAKNDPDTAAINVTNRAGNRSVKKPSINPNPRPRGTPTKSNSSSDSEPGDISPEPIYCLCEKISHGKMVQCDNDLCPIEWFHFGCVNLKKNPKCEWYCPRCRGENFTVMKPKAEFLKELEQYNKQKEMENEIKKQ